MNDGKKRKIEINNGDLISSEFNDDGNYVVYTKEMHDACILSVFAGTNGYQGGDGGHGGVVRFGLICDSGSMTVKTESLIYDVGLIEIIMRGDSEIKQFIEALRFAIEVLECQVDSDE